MIMEDMEVTIMNIEEHMIRGTLIFILTLTGWAGLYAQAPVSLEEAITAGLNTHPQLKAAEMELDRQSALKKGSFSLPDPLFMLEAPTGDFFTPGVQQSIDNPLVYVQQSKVGKQEVQLAEIGIRISKASVTKQVSDTYNELQYAEAGLRQARSQDSIFSALYVAAEKRYKAGDIGILERTSAEAKAKETEVQLSQAESESKRAQQSLGLLMGLGETDPIATSAFEKLEYGIAISAIPTTTPFTDYAIQNHALAKQQVSLAKSALAPGFSFGYMNQAQQSSSMQHRFQFGVTLPLWFWTHASRIKAAKANAERAAFKSDLEVMNFNIAWIEASNAYQKNLASLDYYEETGIEQSNIILDAAVRSYAAGEVSYLEFMYAIGQSFDIKSNYYHALKDHNASVIELNYLNGK